MASTALAVMKFLFDLIPVMVISDLFGISFRSSAFPYFTVEAARAVDTGELPVPRLRNSSVPWPGLPVSFEGPKSAPPFFVSLPAPIRLVFPMQPIL